MQELIELLERIASDHVLSDAIGKSNDNLIREKAVKYFYDFKVVYARIERHRYSEISKYIDTQTPDAIDALRNNVRVIVESARQSEYDMNNAEGDKECYDKLDELYDHIELECYRATNVAEIRSLANEYDKKKQELDELLDAATEKVKETEEKVKGLTQEQISILGIFAGIVVAIAFATSSASGVFADISRGDATYLAFVFSAFGAAFFNVLSLLMYFVGRLSGHKLKSIFPKVVFIVGNLVLVSGTIFFYLRMCRLQG